MTARTTSGLRRGGAPGRAVQRPAGRPRRRTAPTTSTTTPRCAWRGCQGGRRRALPVLVVVQRLRRGGRRLARRERRLSAGHAVRRVEGPRRAGLQELADDDFSPTSLRNATAYGVSPRLRLRPGAQQPGRLGAHHRPGRLLSTTAPRGARSSTSRTSARAFLAVLEAPREAVHGQAFNVGRTGENYRIRELARDRRERAFPGSEVSSPREPAPTCAATASTSPRSFGCCPHSDRRGPSSGVSISCATRSSPSD